MSTSDKDIREQAMLWADRVHESSALSSSERSEFEQFTSAPHQEREFLVFNRIIATVQDCSQADLDRWTQLANTQPQARSVLRKPAFRWVALAASILVAVVLVRGYYAQTPHWFGGEAFVTHTGETRTVTFEEGSVAYLNTRTEVRWIGTNRDRRVELTEGEALFDVVHDDTRPFRVVLDNSEIRVLGTRFNVYRKPNGYVTVSVLEGTVEVRGFGGGGGGDSKAEWVRTLHADEELSYRAIGLLNEPHAAPAGSAAAWRTGYYRFKDQPIESVLEELTRYTDQRIVIRDPRVAEFRINGRLSTRDVRDSLRSLQDLAPIEFKENNKTFTLDYKARADRGKD